MTKPTVRIHNLETGEILDREMTDAEFAKWQSIQEPEFSFEQIEAQAAAKAALLERLGITEEEAKLLLG